MKKAYLHYSFISILIICVSVLFISCDTWPGGEEDAPGAVSQTASITLAASPTSIPADGSSSSAITATLTDGTGAAVATGTSLTFSTTLGTFPNGTTSYATTTADDSGVAVASLRAGTTPGSATVTAESNVVTQAVSVTFSGEDVAGSASTVSLALSQTSVKSDNSDSATVTATVLDVNNAALSGITVAFSSTGGQLSASSVDADANGESQVTFSSGTTDKSNHVVTITATVAGIDPRQIPVQIAGTTITLSTGSTNLEIGGDDTATLTISVKDAGDTGIFGAEVTVGVDEDSSDGAATLALSTGYTEYTTDVSGTLEVDMTATGAGDVTVNVETLGVTASQAYIVGAVGAVFGISSPTDDPHGLSTNTDLAVTVNAPTQTSVQFATSLGTLTGTNPATSGQVINQTVSGGLASAVLNSVVAGVATVQVFDAADPSITDSLTVAISAPSSEASQIALQANATVVPLSTGDVKNTVTLTATVKNASDQVVGGAPVAFSILNPTGGGESISPVIVYTDDYGQATSTFTSGSLSSDAQGVTVAASVVGSSPAIEDSLSIVIGGTAGSVVFGRSTEIGSNETDTSYILPMSVLVADSNGNPMSGVEVTLSVWPSHYSTGYWDEGCDAIITGTYPNEDTDKNLILDTDPDEDANGDGQLTPPNSAAGTLPDTVTTDDNGVANFNLIYLKAFAIWIKDEITASLLVLGTETQSTYTFRLPYELGEACLLPHSLYTSPLIADFTSTDMADSDNVSFWDNSTTARGIITAWSWTFTGGTPATSTAEDPGVVSFGAAGTYQVTLTVTNDLGIQDTEVKAVTVP